MLDILKGEWKLFLRKYFLIFLATIIGSEIAGFVLVKVVLMIDAESTYIYAGAFLMLYALFIMGMILMSGMLNTRYSLLVSMGKKRKSVAGYCTVAAVIISVLFALGTKVLYLYETTFYGRFFQGSVLDGEVTMGFLGGCKFLFIMVATVVIWFMCVLGRRYGATFYAIFFLAIGGVFVVASQFENLILNSGIWENFCTFVVNIPGWGWLAIVALAYVGMLLAGNHILKKMYVKI